MNTAPLPGTISLFRILPVVRSLGAWIVALALLMAVPAAASTPVPVTLQLKWYHQFQFAGF